MMGEVINLIEAIKTQIIMKNIIIFMDLNDEMKEM
jgi:hypothetical protein